MITVIAESKVKEEHLEQVIELSRQLVVASISEPGCIEYRLCQSKDNPCTLLMVEKWKDEEALEMHKASTHVKKIVPMLNELREMKPVVKLFNEL